MSDSTESAAPPSSQMYWSAVPSLSQVDLSLIESGAPGDDTVRTNTENTSVAEDMGGKAVLESSKSDTRPTASNNRIALSSRNSSAGKTISATNKVHNSFEDGMLTDVDSPLASQERDQTLISFRASHVAATSAKRPLDALTSTSTSPRKLRKLQSSPERTGHDVTKLSRTETAASAAESVTVVSSQTSTLADKQEPERTVDPAFWNQPVLRTLADPPPVIPDPQLLAAEDSLFKNFTKHLQKHVVAHDDKVQAEFENRKVPWGTQLLLAAGVTTNPPKWTWTEIMSKLESFQPPRPGEELTDEFCLPGVNAIMLGKPARSDAGLSKIGALYDREQAAILEGKGRNLGLMGEFRGVENYYGGSIWQPATVRKFNNRLSLVLLPPVKSTSCRLARERGSRSIIDVKIDKDCLKDEKSRKEIREFFEHVFVVLGRTFLAIAGSPKDGSILLIEVADEDCGREQSGDCCGVTVGDFIRRHNPLSFNASQGVGKYGARFHLLRSPSVPAVEFLPKNVQFIDDIYAIGCNPTLRKPETGEIMTDGAGFLNKAALLLIARLMNIPDLTAVQGRIAGCKGLWALHPSDESSEPKIWIRTSQEKIVVENVARHHLIFDLLECSQLCNRTPRLSRQSVMNLHHNGVPSKTLIELQDKALSERYDPLLDVLKFKHPNADRIRLIDIVDKMGGVSSITAHELAAGESRARGFSTRKSEKGSNIATDESLLDVSEPKPSTTSTGVPKSRLMPYSQEPISVFESTVGLLKVGFGMNLPALKPRVRKVLEKDTDKLLSKCHIALPAGAGIEAFVFPDPLGILKENEIFYRSTSVDRVDPTTMQSIPSVMTGDVLIGRYPIRLASDIQKVTAVDIPELYNWPNLIIVPSKATWSLNNKLSDGDYDGDKNQVFTYGPLVEKFKCQDMRPVPDGFIEERFESSGEKVASFLSRVSEAEESTRSRELLKSFLGAISAEQVGISSMVHEHKIWQRGYDHEETWKEALTFGLIIDSPKSGLKLRESVAAHFLSVLREPRPKSLDEEKGKGLKRPNSLPSFILDKLLKRGRSKVDDVMKRFDETAAGFENNVQELDGPHKDLPGRLQSLTPLFRKDILSTVLKCEIQLLEDHVESVHKEYMALMAKRSDAKGNPHAEEKSYQAAIQENRRHYHQPIAGVVYLPLLANVEEVKASYAWRRKWDDWAFKMAYSTLCDIKAKASGGVMVIPEVDLVTTISKLALKLLGGGGDHL